MKEKKKSKKKQEQRGEKVWVSLGKGMVIAFAITCIVFIGFGILLTYTSLSEASLPLVSLVSTALSAAAAGYDWAVCMRKKGILWGIAAGVVYTALLCLVTGIARDSFSLPLSALMSLLVAMAGGAVGGILGVNRNV